MLARKRDEIRNPRNFSRDKTKFDKRIIKTKHMCAIEEIGTGNLEYLKEEKGEEKVPITQGQKTQTPTCKSVLVSVFVLRDNQVE